MKIKRLFYILISRFPIISSDKMQLKVIYRMKMGKELNLKTPSTFNEKLQWLKLNDRKNLYTVMVDKYEVKDYISRVLGPQYVVPCYGVWDNIKDVDFDRLPESFVIKTTHGGGGGGVSICFSKKDYDFKRESDRLKRNSRGSLYIGRREWPYKNVKHRFMAEKLLNGQMVDYKFHCFNGEPKMILVCKDRFEESGLTEDFFDVEWNHLDIKRPNHPWAANAIPRPEQLDVMLEIAKKLSYNIPFVRVDLYINEGKIYFGELTFFPASGLLKYNPEKWDKILGNWLKLPNT